MENNSNDISKCLLHNGSMEKYCWRCRHQNRDWWPDHAVKLGIWWQHTAATNPMDKDFNYAAAFKSLDLEAVKRETAARANDRFTGLVAGRLWPLWRPVQSVWHGTAQVLTV